MKHNTYEEQGPENIHCITQQPRKSKHSSRCFILVAKPKDYVQPLLSCSPSDSDPKSGGTPKASATIRNFSL